LGRVANGRKPGPCGSQDAAALARAPFHQEGVKTFIMRTGPIGRVSKDEATELEIALRARLIAATFPLSAALLRAEWHPSCFSNHGRHV